MYHRLIKKGGIVRLKTDSTSLFEFTLEVLKEREDVANLQYTFDLYHSLLKPECLDIRTRYEQKFSAEGHDIKYLRFQFS